MRKLRIVISESTDMNKVISEEVYNFKVDSHEFSFLIFMMIKSLVARIMEMNTAVENFYKEG